MNKITCICLGVRDMERSIKFYRDGLGYKTDCKENNPPVCFFDTPGTKFELFPLEQLAKDIDENNPPKGNGFSGITLAYNVEHKEDVDSVIELVRNVGGKIVKEPQDTFWGGYHAYFSDLDGYYWEVAWGPNFKFDEKWTIEILVIKGDIKNGFKQSSVKLQVTGQKQTKEKNGSMYLFRLKKSEQIQSLAA